MLLLVYLYLKKNPEKTKKEKITLYISIPLFALMIGYYFGIISVNGLNYALDKSEPIINSYEIIKLKNGDEESDKAIILIDGKEYSISISDYEYRTLEVGDMLEVYYYEGAFNLAYYIHYSEE